MSKWGSSKPTLYKTQPGQIENIVLSNVVLTPKGTVVAYCRMCGQEHRTWYAAAHYRSNHPDILQEEK